LIHITAELAGLTDNVVEIRTVHWGDAATTVMQRPPGRCAPGLGAMAGSPWCRAYGVSCCSTGRVFLFSPCRTRR